MLRYAFLCLCLHIPYYSCLYYEFLTLNDDLLYQRGAALEIYMNKVVHVNGKALDKAAKVTLIGGDEVMFVSLGTHAYVSFPTTSYFLLCFSEIYFPCWKFAVNILDGIQASIWIRNSLMCWQIFQQLLEEKASTPSLCSKCVIQQEQYPVVKGTFKIFFFSNTQLCIIVLREEKESGTSYTPTPDLEKGLL